MRPPLALALAAPVALVAALLPATLARATTVPTLTGTVRFAGTTEPGTTVGWFEPDTDDEGTTSTAGDGTFTLPLPASGHGFVVFAGLPHASSARMPTDEADDAARPAPQVVGSTGVFYGSDGADYAYQTRTWFAPGTSIVEDLELPAAGVIAGAGADLAGETVELHNLHGDVVGSTGADTHGAFTFDVVPGRYRVWADRDATHRAATSPIVTATPGATAPVTVTRTVGATLSGTVTSGGRAASGVTVSGGGRSTRTGPGGSYQLTGLPLGTLTVHFGRVGTASSHVAVVPQNRSITGLASASTRHLNVSLAKGASIIGTYDSGPDADQYLTVVTRRTAGGSVVTGDMRAAHGTTSRNPVAASGLAAGTYVVRAYDVDGSHYAERTVTLKAGAAAKLGVLKPTLRALSLQGDLHGAPSGEIIAMQRNHAGAGFATASGGHYAIYGLLPGAYTVYDSAPSRTTTHASVTLSRSSRLALTAGTRFGTFTAAVTIGGHPTDGVSIDEDLPAAADPLGFDDRALEGDDFADGTGMTGDGAPGVHHVDEVTPYSDPFQADSPYWYAWPTGRTITLTSGRTTAVGTVALVLAEAPGAIPADPTPVPDPTDTTTAPDPTPTDTTTPDPDPSPTDTTPAPDPTDTTTPPDPTPTDTTTPDPSPSPTDTTQVP